MPKKQKKIWQKPEIKIIGDASKVVKSFDSPGTNDSLFPNNLISP